MKTLHVFIDTNVFLNFFAYTGDDIDQLKKLVGAIKSGAMKLYLPRHVVAEFTRNRERRIKDSIDAFAGAHLSKEPPRLLADYPSIKEFTAAIAAAEAARNALVAAVREDARKTTLAADKLFEALREAAGVIEPTPELLDRARDRQALGNPPGKGNSMGDQLNWETLLEHVEHGVDLHIVSKDGDYKSVLFSANPHQYLADEWRVRKAADLVLHSEIKPLLNAWFPTIKLKIDQEKAAAIEALKTSGSFASTHEAIEKLMPFVELLTQEDVVALAKAASVNSQIYWIAGDSDVAEFYERILSPVLQELPADLREDMTERFELDDGGPSSND